MIRIATEKRVNWHKIRAEYIAGTSQRKLAEKYGVSHSAIEKQCRNGKWTEDRKAAKGEIAEKVIQKTAEMAADNATLAADIKRKGLMILAGLFDDFANVRATEHRESNGAVTDIKRLRDLTAAYKDLTEDMTKTETDDSPILRSLFNLMNEGHNHE